jgi:hypothetical protein
MTKTEALQEVQALFDSIERDSVKLLDLLGAGSFQAPIKGTDQYVVAGTLEMIAKVLPAAPTQQAVRVPDEHTAMQIILNHLGAAGVDYPKACEVRVGLWKDLMAAAPTAQEVSAQASPDDVRSAAIELAAKEVEKRFIGYRDDDADLREIAASIRALKTTPGAAIADEKGEQK